MQCHLLSPREYTQLLQTLHKTTEVEYVRAQLHPISENVEGFLGEHSTLHLTYKRKRDDVTTTEVFFLKRKPQNNKIQSDLSNELCAYLKEIFVFDNLIKKFENYGCDTSFAAKCFFVVPGEALIFENLKTRGFSVNHRHKSFTIAQTQCALRALAKFHGAGIIHDLKKTTELRRKYSLNDEFPDIFTETVYVMGTNPTGFLAKMWNGSLRTFRTIINLLPGDDAFKQKFTSMVFEFKFGAVFTQSTNYLKTCGHGDLWSNNLMFKYDGEGGEPIECRLLDFQICRFFYPALDVVLLVFANTTPSFREKNLQKLYEYYYGCVSGVLSAQGYQLDGLMTFGDFLETVKLVLRDALLQVNSGLLGGYLPVELLTSLFKGGNTDKLEEFMFDNGKMCAEAFKNNEKYRNFVTDMFQEYFKILLSYE